VIHNDPDHRMNHRNWVCFDCRSVVRREAYTVDSVVCATCSQPRVNLGYKIPIPAKTRAKEWERLREQYFASQRAATRARGDAQRKKRRDLTKEIERLESRSANPGRSKAVQLIRKKLRRTDV
jgi:predicted secreted Zn-dependent protease